MVSVFLQESVPNYVFFKVWTSLPDNIHSFKKFFDTHFVFIKYCTSCKLKIKESHVAISVKFRLIVQP